MTLQELKALMGIAVEDTSQDAILSLYLEAAFEAAKQYANGYDWNSTDPLPGPIKLGILRYVELARQRKSRSGVVSESIAGMSKTYANSISDEEYYREAFDFWFPYRKRGVTFQAARRAYNPNPCGVRRF